jgi:1-acyl-sn-glycerol-3-phosphate acyltransferase
MTNHESRIHEPGPHPLYYDTVIKTIMKPIVNHYGIYSEGAEILREIGGPAIVSPVHRSMLDIPAVSVAAYEGANEHIHFMAKKELWKPVLKHLISLGGGFMIDRDQPAMPEETEQHIRERIENNALIGIFPEGTRLSGDIVNEKSLKGVPLLATKYGLTIVPVGITGTEKGSRGPFAVVFGEPIKVAKAETDVSAARAAVKLRGVLGLAMQIAQDKAASLNKY